MSDQLPTWKCHVCGATRPDNKISVFQTDMSHTQGLPEGTFMQNVRYCNDNPACIAQGKTKRLIWRKLQPRITEQLTKLKKADAADTSNRFLVAMKGENIIFLTPVPQSLSRSDALNLAAWIAAIAGVNGEFDRMLKEIQNS